MGVLSADQVGAKRKVEVALIGTLRPMIALQRSRVEVVCGSKVLGCLKDLMIKSSSRKSCSATRLAILDAEAGSKFQRH